MTFNDYQEKAEQTAKYPNKGNFQGLIYCVLGINGESGEFTEKIKKIMRDKNGIISSDDKKEIQKELGDILWYIAKACDELGFSLDETAELNLEKLFSRKERGVLSGSGDNR